MGNHTSNEQLLDIYPHSFFPCYYNIISDEKSAMRVANSGKNDHSKDHHLLTNWLKGYQLQLYHFLAHALEADKVVNW